MTSFVDDSFTEASDTILSSHTPETGGAWSKLEGETLYVLGGQGLVRSAQYAGGRGFYVNATAPASADYTLSGTFVNYASNYGGTGLCARVNGVDNDRYEAGAYRDGSNNPVSEIHKYVGGVQTVLATGDAFGYASGDVYKFELAGTSLKLYRNNVLIHSITDSSITAVGTCGFYSSNAASGYATDGSLSSFTADEAAAGGGTTITQATTFASSTAFHGGVIVDFDAFQSDAFQSDAFQVPAGAAGALTQASTFTDADTFPAAALRFGLTQASSLADADTFHAASVKQALQQALGFTDADTFPAASLSLRMAQASSYTDPDTFHAASLLLPQTLTQASTFTDGDTFPASALRLGLVQATSVPTVNAFPAAALRLQLVEASSYADPDTFHGGSLSQSGGPQTITQASTFASAAAFYGGTLVGGSLAVVGGEALQFFRRRRRRRGV